MDQFIFEPIGVNSDAPGGACILRTFDDVGAFILNNADTKNRRLAHWQAVLQHLPQARFGARRAEAHAAMRDALFVKGWLGLRAVLIQPSAIRSHASISFFAQRASLSASGSLPPTFLFVAHKL